MDNKKAKSLYHFICLVSTFGLFCYCVWKFIQDKSNALVDFRSFHNEKKDIYPSFTICFQSPVEIPGSLKGGTYGIYNVSKLKKLHGIDDLKSYVDFLGGKFWNEPISVVNYDDVTINLEDYVDAVGISLNTVNSAAEYVWHKHGVQYFNTSNRPKISFPFFNSLRHSMQKCFTIDFTPEIFAEIQGQKISLLTLLTTNLPFFDGYLRYYIHYPGQLMRAVHLDMEFGESGIRSGHLDSKYLWVHNIEVIRRRDTFNTPCNKNSYKDEELITTTMLDQTKCKPPHWVDVDLPTCNDSISIMTFNINTDFPDTNFLEPTLKPCDQVQTATFTIQEVARAKQDSNLNSSASLGIAFNSPVYREIQHTQDFNLESLVGNIGGYIGLFLGFAFWQLPDAISNILNKHGQT